MRRMLLWTMLLMLLMLLMLTGCRGPVTIPFAPDVEGVVDVSVRSGEMLYYYAVAADGRTQKTDPFQSDTLTVWMVDSDCFDTYKGIDNRGRLEFINRLVDVRVRDENGAPVPRTQTLMKVLQAVSWLEHDLWEVRILRAGDAWFVYVELNVTGGSPCTLYWYDPARDGLVEVCSFNGKEMVGLRVRDLTGLAARPLEPKRLPQTAAHNPLASFDGGYRLVLQDRSVDLVGPDGVVARRVTGWWSFVSRTENAAGFVSAAGFHVLDEHTGTLQLYADFADVPAQYAEHFADEGFFTLNRFRNAYGPGDFTSEAAALRARFGANRAACDGLVAAADAHPDWLTDRNILVTAGVRKPFGNDGWSTSRPESPDWAAVDAAFTAMDMIYVGREGGAVYLHFAPVADDGRSAPMRLYYAPDAADAAACSAGWTAWESLGDGWYMAVLTEE